MFEKTPKFDRKTDKAARVLDVVSRAHRASPITDSKESLDPALRRLGARNIL